MPKYSIKVKVEIEAANYEYALEQYQRVADKMERGRWGKGVRVNTYVGVLEEEESETGDDET